MSGPQLYEQRLTVFWKVFPMEDERLSGCENFIDVQFGYA